MKSMTFPSLESLRNQSYIFKIKCLEYMILTHGFYRGPYLSERECPSVIFERVLHGPQLSEFREVGKRLQPADGSF